MRLIRNRCECDANGAVVDGHGTTTGWKQE